LVPSLIDSLWQNNHLPDPYKKQKYNIQVDQMAIFVDNHVTANRLHIVNDTKLKKVMLNEL